MSRLSFSSTCFLLSCTLLFAAAFASNSTNSSDPPQPAAADQTTVVPPAPSPSHRHQSPGFVGVVTAMFVFGDSLVDNGNNAFLTDTSGSVKYPPYGMDFPLGATGRFTNGRNPSDWLTSLMGLPRFLPNAKDPQSKGTNIMRGLNYASGGSGILDDTCKDACISLGQQISLFEKQTLPDLLSQLQNDTMASSSSYLAKSLFVFNTGGNDCSKNCYQQGVNCSSVEVITPIVRNLTQQIKKLYDLGARKFVLFGVQAIGCTPSARRTLPEGNAGCVEQMNQAAIVFNDVLCSFMDSLQLQMPGSNFVFVDTYNIAKTVSDNPESHKIKVTNETCCTLSSKGYMCAEGGNTCQNRQKFLYFDALHFTDTFYSHLAATAYLSRNKDLVYPYNIRHLASL